MWFCEKKCMFFSRNFLPGEGGRVLPEQPACAEFEVDASSKDNETKETGLDESEL